MSSSSSSSSYLGNISYWYTRISEMVSDESLLKVEKELHYGVFSDKPENEDDVKKSLDQLINNLAEDAIRSFLGKAEKSFDLGKKLNGIHPLTTFEYFLATEERKKKVYHIYDQNRCHLLNPNRLIFTLLINRSIKIYALFLQMRHAKNDLEPHLDNFSTKTGLDKNKLIKIITDTDKETEDRFIKFVKLILENKSLDAQ